MKPLTRVGMVAAVLLSGGAACSGSGSSSAGDALGSAGRDAVADEPVEDDAGDLAPSEDAGRGTTEPDAAAEAEPDGAAAPPDVGDDADAAADAGVCDLGTAQNGATAENLDLFGAVTWFAGGSALPAGRYRVRYLDGCMKYGLGQDWTIHAYADGSIAWWIVDDASDNLVMAPGTVGFAASNGAFADFEACVAENLASSAPVELDYAGGRLGVLVRDSPVGDNMAGVDGRNPSYRLEAVEACVTPLPDL
jgi:hypothetical protein